MLKFRKLIIWLCKKFDRDELLELIHEINLILKDKYSDIKPRDDFKEKHPNYRNFKVDPLAPLQAVEFSKPMPSLDYKELLNRFQKENGRPLKPVNHNNKNNIVPQAIRCPNCNAPHQYIYFNDGKKRSQLKCKVCQKTFQVKPQFKKDKSKYYCPYCNRALFLWKQYPDYSVYKCGNRNCPHRIQQLNKLNEDERKLRAERPSQFKLAYQYREYYYNPDELKTAEPLKPKVSLNKIYNDIHVLALVLTLHISYAITARKTAHMLYNIWGIKISYQTVLNYVQTAAFYCHRFNQKFKGQIDQLLAGDETYVKVKGKWHYVWLVISTTSKKIVAYHFSNNRSVKPAITVLLDMIANITKNLNITLVTDGNPSYVAALHFVNAQIKNFTLTLKKVIGLKNLDAESEEFRAFKQIIERLNRTFKYHIQGQNGFNSINGAVSKLVLFVTHYNFLRPHKSLNYRTPIEIPQLQEIQNIQGKWAKILQMVA